MRRDFRNKTTEQSLQAFARSAMQNRGSSHVQSPEYESNKLCRCEMAGRSQYCGWYHYTHNEEWKEPGITRQNAGGTGFDEVIAQGDDNEDTRVHEQQRGNSALTYSVGE